MPIVLAGRDLPDAPPHFQEDEAAIWDIIVICIEPILDTADFAAVEGASTMLARARQAKRLVEQEGLVVVNEKGRAVLHPALILERQSLQAFVVFADRLGLSPVARAKLGMQLVKGKAAKEQLEDSIGKSPLDEPPPSNSEAWAAKDEESEEQN